ncbi:MAG: Serine/threonine-protein kinase tel1 [Candelina mexicana]|nr:MAG: Serine/threonine-protein kinase tel1 [Candelina mexicana]
MGEVNINEAIERIRSGKVKERSDGLADLKHILIQNRRSSKLEALNDKSYHKIYEAIYHVAKFEKASYIRPTKGPVKNASSSRLSLCASVLRLAVELGLKKLKIKTVKSLAEHITQTLPTPTEGYCEPLSLDYIKTLRTVLEYQPHVEHLLRDDWNLLVDFCNAGLRSFGNDGESQSSDLSTGHYVFGEPNDRGTDVVGTRWSATRPFPDHALGDFHSKTNAEELVLCLRQLTAAPNADILQRAQDILVALTGYLQSAITVGRAHPAAFITINSVLLRTTTDCISLTQQALRELLPLIRRLWPNKTASLKDELLITCIYGKAYLPTLLTSQNAEISRRDLEGLLEALILDYSKRSERDHLQLDDLALYTRGKARSETSPLRVDSLGLRVGALRSEQAWMTVLLIADFMAVIDFSISQGDTTSDTAMTNGSNKRRKTGDHYDEVLRQIRTPAITGKLWALQVLAFRLTQDSLNVEQMKNALDALMSCVPNENHAVASWAMVGIASSVYQGCACANILQQVWVQIWQLASRSATSQSTCRAACYLMDAIIAAELVHYNAIADIVDGIVLSSDINGPPIPVDTALSLWTTLIHFRIIENPSSSKTTSEHALRWLFAKWHPEPAPHLETSENGLAVDDQSYSATRHHALDVLVLDFCILEFEKVRVSWTQLVTERVQHVTPEMIRSVTSIYFMGLAITSCTDFRDTRKVGELRGITEQLLMAIAELVSQGCEQSLVDGVLEAVHPYLPDILTLGTSANDQVSNHGTDHWAYILTTALETRTQHIEHNKLEDGPNLMDIDEDFESQVSYGRSDTMEGEISREYLSAHTGNAAYRQSVSTYIHFISSFVGLGKPLEYEKVVPSSFIGYLISLRRSDFLSCSTFLDELASSEWRMNRGDAARVLEYLGSEFMQCYEYERCEVSMVVCLTFMTALAEIWTEPGPDDLSDIGSSFYRWFVDTARGKGITSSRVQIAIATFLQRLLSVRPDYSKGLSLSSVRTSLFSVLHEGNISVKFHLAEHISEIFGLFILTKHEEIFSDVHATLPLNIDWAEGIALRMMVLARLASTWKTLLRRCVYHLFETAGSIPSSGRHATRCLLEVSRALSLTRPEEVFRLFATQLLYTWLESQSLQSIPYMAFGYANLPDLLNDVQDEIVGQLVMRGKDDEAAILGEVLGRPFDELLVHSFGKTLSYSIASDIARSRHEGAEALGAEARIRQRLGKTEFLALVNSNLAPIIVVLFRSIEQEEQIERAFAKRPLFEYAGRAMKEMKAISSSETVPTANQQPSFRARYLIDEIEHVCRRTRYDLTQLWTPALLTYVLRELLETIHPALGPLHACSVIRKIRILVCIAGDIALHDYPLEQLLNALRPFISDHYCADDVIGLIQYLLQHSKPYLTQTPTFLAGISLSILASLRSFLSSVQESTTQESQYRATKSTAQAFHSWFGQFLDSYDSSNLEGSADQAFRVIVRSARGLGVDGNATNGTNESDLLRELLKDDGGDITVLDRPSLELARSLLCRHFQRPSTFHEDIFGSNALAAANAVTVWRSCQSGVVGNGYLLWAGRVLGRAYASTGELPIDLTREQELDEISSLHLSSNRPSLNSTSAILELLCNLLLSDKQTEVGIAERTLRDIGSRLATQEELSVFGEALPTTLLKALDWTPYQPPPDVVPRPVVQSVQSRAFCYEDTSKSQWIRDLAVALAYAASSDTVLGALPRILLAVDGFAERAFPYLLHLILAREFAGHQAVRQVMSEAYREWFRGCRASTKSHVKLLLTTVLYLRKQPIPNEATRADRERWLDLDYIEAANAAAACNMHKTALLFVEIGCSTPASTSRRSSIGRAHEPTDLLISIFRSIEEPDSFYGVQHQSSLRSIMDRLEYERDGFKSLFFRGAHFDCHMRLLDTPTARESSAIVNALNTLNLSGISHSLLNSSQFSGTSGGSAESLLQTARKLEQWDIQTPRVHPTEASTIFRAFQSLNTFSEHKTISQALDCNILEMMTEVQRGGRTGLTLHSSLRTLAVLTEIDELTSSTGVDCFYEAWSRMQSRQRWMHTGRFEDVSQILSCRETLLSSFSKQPHLQAMVRINPKESRLIEVNALLETSRTCRDHGALQNSLTATTYLSNLIEPCKMLGLTITAAVQAEEASVLWDQGEMTASIRLLQNLSTSDDLSKQSIHVGKSGLLAKLAHQIAEARLEKPDVIIDRYLSPAVKELHGKTDGNEAGQVFHEFASFCDQQLQNSDNLEDFQRIQKLRQRKESEVHELERMIKSSGSEGKDNLRVHRTRAKQWFELDDREYQRLRQSRESFLRQSLENYLLCLQACEAFNNDVLRFCALWLDQSESEIACSAVTKYLAQVASRKFAPLMNQLSSRLLDVEDGFQSLLFSLVLRVCMEHPYHGMYQIFAGSKTKGGRDEMALSRHAAAGKIVSRLKTDKQAAPIWAAVNNSNVCFVKFAIERLDEHKYKPGTKVPLRKVPQGRPLEQEVPRQKVPPPTIRLTLRADCNYTDVPVISKFYPDMTIASGVSAPKILVAVGSDGLKYKQLFKGGNDDLRQDSIMEQVFDQVSALLQNNRLTRQRNLRIRTYKVLPLTANAGIIEFVQDTVPLHDYLMPAHSRHFPKDFKPNVCRKTISDVQSKSVDVRLKAYRQVADHFHPVMKYFFLEHFNNPDDWFEKKLAYSRSTAAISILGYVLGLGDRHGHNILLDEKTGEVVHIDLGVAFEQGRVLPVPEVVPFRMTRDVVDGMGITKTEGVFRRCCEFTLEALRQESYSIMTILDVLRYDPLYSWSISPLRVKKMQEAQSEVAPPSNGDATAAAAETSKKRADSEPGEADRALTVVSKKLSKSMSVTATVNELILQATDERNLAVLYCGRLCKLSLDNQPLLTDQGWAAYA